MAKQEKDPVSGVETTGHEWDGIKELNNPVPRWWLYIFYVCCAWSLVYWVLYPAWPMGTWHTAGILGWTQRAEVEQKIADAKVAQSGFTDRIAAWFQQLPAIYTCSATTGRGRSELLGVIAETIKELPVPAEAPAEAPDDSPVPSPKANEPRKKRPDLNRPW